ncbi:MAG TPA: hypothetical protein VNO70_07105 [Blastocatellia bacterium]|nr:hypothetical protein [Blastocatellia bacterium]
MSEQPTNSAALYRLRQLIILGALLTLCISEGVGLQLLPLPITIRQWAVVNSPEVNGSSGPARAPSPSTPQKIEMAAPTPSRAAVEQQVIQCVAAVFIILHELSDPAPPPTRANGAHAYRPPALASPSPSRAPPSIA